MTKMYYNHWFLQTFYLSFLCYRISELCNSLAFSTSIHQFNLWLLHRCWSCVILAFIPLLNYKNSTDVRYEWLQETNVYRLVLSVVLILSSPVVFHPFDNSDHAMLTNRPNWQIRILVGHLKNRKTVFQSSLYVSLFLFFIHLSCNQDIRRPSEDKNKQQFMLSSTFLFLLSHTLSICLYYTIQW